MKIKLCIDYDAYLAKINLEQYKSPEYIAEKKTEGRRNLKFSIARDIADELVDFAKGEVWDALRAVPGVDEIQDVYEDSSNAAEYIRETALHEFLDEFDEKPEPTQQQQSEAAQQRFCELHPDYISNFANGRRMEQWLNHHLPLAPWTVENITKAYEALKSDGLLQLLKVYEP
jgi:hypothetical protein